MKEAVLKRLGEKQQKGKGQSLALKVAVMWGLCKQLRNMVKKNCKALFPSWGNGKGDNDAPARELPYIKNVGSDYHKL